MSQEDNAELCKRFASGSQSFLVVFDFDHTVLDCNSDINIPKYLGRQDLQKELIKKDIQWTYLISALLAPFSKEEIASAARESVVVDPGVKETMKLLQRCQTLAPHWLEVCIASDANTLFIDEILAEHFPFLNVSQIHTNYYHDLRGVEPPEVCKETGEVRLSKLTWYESEPEHTCPLCLYRGRPHMCKSRIIQRCLRSTRLIDPTVIFIGDGGNDYCPVLNALRPRDYVFAREGYPLCKDLVARRGGCCHARVWKDGSEMLKLFESVVLPKAKQLPTIARFGDGPVSEFRNRTLSTRVPPVIDAILSYNKEALSDEAVHVFNELKQSMRMGALGHVLPLPGHVGVQRWIENYSAVSLFPGELTDATGGTTVRWGQLPWLQGEIYLYNLMLHIAHIDAAKGEEKAMRLYVSPYAFISPIVQSVGYQDHCARQRCCAEEEMSSIAHVNKEPGDVDHGPDHKAPANFEHQHLDCSDLVEPMYSPFSLSKTEQPMDIFRNEKLNALRVFLTTKIVPMVETSRWMADASQSDSFAVLKSILLGMLWGNKVDLCFKKVESSTVDADHSRHTEVAFECEDKILQNDLDALTDYILRLAKTTTTVHIDIVLDNSGVELAADLVFVAWALSHSEWIVITLHGKPCGFYVSDTTSQDLEDLLSALQNSGSGSCSRFVQVLRHHLDNTKRLRFVTDPCWVMPLEYRDLPPQVVGTFFYTESLHMPQYDPDALLHSSSKEPRVVHYAKTQLVLFKGDLNFRRLIGDRHWDHRSFFAETDVDALSEAQTNHLSTLFANSVCARAAPTLKQAIEDYWPFDTVPVAALRTLKSELCCGIDLDVLDRLDRDSNKNWRVSGEYAVALFTGAV